MAGLTDKMQSDFHVMKDLAIHTRLAPEQQRAQEVGRFLNHIHKDDNVQKELIDCGLGFDTKLLCFAGRIFPRENFATKYTCGFPVAFCKTKNKR